MKNKLIRVISWYNKETLIEKISNNSILFNILSKPVEFGTSNEEIRRIKNENEYKKNIRYDRIVTFYQEIVMTSIQHKYLHDKAEY